MQEQNCQKDEINLMDYIKVIIKRKKIVMSIFIICVAVTTIVSFQTPRMLKIYRVDSTVRIGTIEGRLLSIEKAREEAKNRNLLQSVIQEIDKDTTVEYLKKAIKIEEIKGTNFLTVQMESAEPDMAIDILNKIESKLVSDGNIFYEKKLALINERIQELNLRKESISKQKEIFDKKISNNKVNLAYPIIQNTIINYETIYSELSAAEYSLKKSLLEAKNFKIIESPSKSINSINKSNTKHSIIISAVVGLMLGVFIAFFVEFWQKNKEDRK